MARLGGDEFVVIAPGSGGLGVADRVIRAVQALPAVDGQRLGDRPGGNPLCLHGRVGAAARGTDVDDLPDPVEAVIASRIDAFPDEARSVLRSASVLGSRFPRALLASLLGVWAILAFRS